MALKLLSKINFHLSRRSGTVSVNNFTVLVDFLTLCLLPVACKVHVRLVRSFCVREKQEECISLLTSSGWQVLSITWFSFILLQTICDTTLSNFKQDGIYNIYKYIYIRFITIT